MQGGVLTNYGNVLEAGEDHYFSFAAAEAFDSIEAVVSLSGNASEQIVRLYEFCGDR